MKRNRSVLKDSGLAILMVLGLLLGLVNPGWAATYTVTTNADSGAGSLRQAISDANVSVGVPDTIDFAVSSITLTSGEIPISDDLTIQGPGAANLTISGNNTSRIFTVASGKTVVINDLTLQNGYTTAFAGGGAILNSGVLTVQHSALISNVSNYAGTGQDVGGGAIANASGGILTIADSTIANNSSNLLSTVGAGGGIWSNGTLTILRSTLSGNKATSNGGGGLFAAGSTNVTIDSSTLSGNTGGGANFEGGVATVTNSTVTGNANGGINSLTSGTLKLINSTIASNTIDRGIWNYQGTLIITNSTVSGNPQGGIYVGSGTASITNSTITGNGNASIDGGGIYSFGPVTIGNSLVAGNMGSFANMKEMLINVGPITSQGYNLFGENGDPGISWGYTAAAGDLTLPGLVSAAINTTLADNGGPTKTHLPVASGPAINAGLDGLVPTGVTTDQRGATRFNGTVDIGAVEGSVVTSSIVTPYAALNGSISPNTPQTVNYNTTTSFTVTPGSGYTALVTGCGGSLTGSLYITGPITSNCTVVASFIPNPAVLVVTKLADTADGTCDADCSLREAVVAANGGVADTISFKSGLTGTIALTGGEIAITDNLTIQGPSAANLTIARNTSSPNARIFTVNPGVTVSINGLTFRDGLSSSPGGAILNDGGTLTITSSIFDNNESTWAGSFAGGGAIANRANGTNLGNLTVTNGTFTSNKAVIGGAINNEDRCTATVGNSRLSGNLASASSNGGGGGIFSQGTLTVDTSVLSSNTATFKGGGILVWAGTATTTNLVNSELSGNTAKSGGGFSSEGSGSTVEILSSTVSGNTSNGGITHGGGGLLNYLGTLKLINSTVSGNTSINTGGGIENYGLVTLTNSTLTANNATTNGGGIYTEGTVITGNSLIVGNSPNEMRVSSAGPGVLNSQGYNLVGYTGTLAARISNGGTSNFPQTGDITPTAALNAIIDTTLADNGGPTKTHLPVVGSPAINVGLDGLVPTGVTTDQRGATRFNGTVDIGAVEAGGYLLTVTLVGSTGSGAVSNGGSIACPGTCTAFFTTGSAVTLTATANTGFTFTGWSGACTGTGTCSLTMNSAQAVTATFSALPTYTLTVNKLGTGTGTVVSTIPPTTINCGATCSASFTSGTAVTLSAAPDAGSSFTGWGGSGGCTGTGTCAVTMSGNLTANASFAPVTTFVVTNLNDSGTGSLRQVVADANAVPGHNDVTFQTGLTGIITLTTGEITITEDLKIQGPGASTLAVSGNNASRIFTVYHIPAASPLTVTIDGLTLKDGKASDSNGGGAIQNHYSTLTVSNSVLINNASTSANGGAIANNGTATLNVANSTLSGNNAAVNCGGALANNVSGFISISDSILSSNTAGNGGGAIANDCFTTGGTLTITNSTLSGNTAGAYGGAIDNGGTLTITNSTLSGNTSSGNGGALDSNGTIKIINSTLSGNSAPSGSGGAMTFYSGTLTILNSTLTANGSNDSGGIYLSTGFGLPDPSLIIGNTLVAGNNASTNREIFVATGSVFTSQGHNLFGVNNDAGITGALPNAGLGDIVPGTGVFIGNIIGGLANNGGPTQTHLPLPNSLGNTAIDAGDDVLATTAGLTTDQRGSGFPRKVGSRVDIGAVEEANGYFPLTVTRTGSGSGTVSSSPPGISCGTACTQSYVNGTVVTLTATPDVGSTFTSWGGACSGTGSCVVTMSIAQNVTATFNLATYTVTPSAGANGSISPNTPQPAALNQQLTFTVNPNPGYTATVGGTCGGTLAGTTYTTNPVTASCTVIASFSSSPTLSINNVSQNEGNTGTTPFVFTVTLSTAASLPVTVNWTTSAGTATAGSDYTAATGSLSFPVGGPLTQTITVQVTGDTLTEPNETFFINLNTPVNAAIAQAQGTGTILNDDGVAHLTGIAWSSSQFLAVGTGGAALSSPDGVNWTTRNTGTSEDLNGIAWSGSRFVAVGNTGTALTSPDGATWTVITPPPTPQDFYGIVWSGSQFVAVGSGGAILTSPNATTWTPQSAGTTVDLLGIAWSGSQFVAVGNGGVILTSATGTTWSLQSSGSPADLYGIAWSGSEFVAVGDGGVILASPNGLTWPARSSGTSQDLRSIAWSGSQFLTVGNAGVAFSSPDGIAWTAQISGTTQPLNGVIWAGNRFIAVGNNDTILPITVQSVGAKILNSNVWTAIALPVTPTAPGTVQSVLGNSLGGTYDTDWVVWSYEQATYQSRKLAATDPLLPGLGYWIYKSSPGSVSLTATGTATPVVTGNPNCPTAAGCYEIALTAPPGSTSRYTLLGMPFPYPVGWWDVRLQVDGVGYTLNNPANVYAAPTYWLWNGNGYDSYDGTTPGMVGILQPWQGFWMQVHPASQGHSLKLLIPPIPKYGFTPPALIPAITQSPASPGFRALDWLMAPAAAESASANPAWYVRLIAEEPTRPMRDRNNVFGQSATAAVGHDPHDLPKMAPFSPPFLNVVFPHPDWGLKAGDYASDYRPNHHNQGRGLPAETWHFEIRTDRADYAVKLRWEGPPEILSRSVLVDDDTGIRYPASDPVILDKGIPLTMTAPIRHFTWVFAGQSAP